MERQCKQKGERACKPGSVLGRPFISNASRPAPLARNPSARRATVWRSYLRLLQMGFTKPRRCRRAGALLPHRFSFSPVSRMLRIAACSEQGSLLFCGTDPSGRPAQPLAGILPCGARTFLAPRKGTRPSGSLACGIVAELASPWSNHTSDTPCHPERSAQHEVEGSSGSPQ